jgi:hypothetical protein
MDSSTAPPIGEMMAELILADRKPEAIFQLATIQER